MVFNFIGASVSFVVALHELGLPLLMGLVFLAGWYSFTNDFLRNINEEVLGE